MLQDLRNLVRVGNCLVVGYNRAKEIETVHYAKRGLKYTFELSVEHLQNLEKLQDQETKENEGKVEVSDLLFSNAVKHIHSSEECSMNIVKVNQFDGVNVQISYNEYSLCWLFGTRTQTIAAHEAKDVGRYSDKEFFSLKRTAESFFSYLNSLDKKLVEGLMGELSKYTLVGQYIGDYKLQQIIRYSNPDIMFNAMVATNKNTECLPPEEAFNIFDIYSLNHGGFEKCKPLKKEENIVSTISELIQHIRSANLEQEESGSLLYIVLQRGDMQKVTSLTEVKTTEFNIYSTLKKRILSLLFGTKNANEDFEEFKEELYGIVGETDLHHSLNYYLNVADTAYGFCCDFPNQAAFVRDYFVTFISVVIYSLHQNRNVTPTILKDKKLRTIEKNSWYRYSMGSLNLKNIDNVKGMKKTRSKAPEYSRKVVPSQSNTREKKEEIVEKASEQNSLGTFPIQTQEEPSKLSLTKPCSIAVILPLSIPGMGIHKYSENLSTLLKDSKVGSSFSIIDYEKIRSVIQEQEKGLRGKLGVEEYLKQTNEKSSTQLEIKIKEAVQEAEQNPDRLSVIFVLRHFNNSSAGSLISRLRTQIKTSPEAELRYFCLATSSHRIEGNISIGLNEEEVKYPFNHHILLTCLKRQLGKAPSRGSDVLDVDSLIENTITHFKNFRGLEISSKAAKDIGFDGFIGFPFTNISNEEQFISRHDYPEISRCIDACLTETQDKLDYIRYLRDFLSNFQAAPEWWDVRTENAETSETEYDSYLLRSVGTLVKKFNRVHQKVVKRSY